MVQLDLPDEHHDRAAPDIAMNYWMNRLQSLDRGFPLIETLNPVRPLDFELVYDTFEFEHPVFDTAAVSAQERIRIFRVVQHLVLRRLAAQRFP